MNPIFGSKNMSVAYLNGSRNDIIDTAISPGPYKEVLPCKELCYDLIQSCPASLGFACPLKGHGLELSYGHVQKGEAVTCNWPGRIWGENAAGRVSIRRLGLALGIKCRRARCTWSLGIALLGWAFEAPSVHVYKTWV